MLFSATVQFKDDKSIVDELIFKLGDIEEDDDSIFYYLDSESEMDILCTDDGALDFKILNYKLWEHQ
jgi:hypothetical protein